MNMHAPITFASASPALQERIDAIVERETLHSLIARRQIAASEEGRLKPIWCAKAEEINARVDQALPHITRGFANASGGRTIWHSGNYDDELAARRMFDTFRKGRTWSSHWLPKAASDIRALFIRRGWMRRKLWREAEAREIEAAFGAADIVLSDIDGDIIEWVWTNEAERVAKAAAMVSFGLHTDEDGWHWDWTRWTRLTRILEQLRMIDAELGPDADAADDNAIGGVIAFYEHLLVMTPARSAQQFAEKVLVALGDGERSVGGAWGEAIVADAQRWSAAK
ncbi:hypothetical protein ABC347_10835 [Sphingomonas sp. 1P06PA]|uniref:hypothetical protein n=1 Tax=Sphingomonas sp. 1P06PA TaxID=554121 RepID=UPI0039A70A79